jgi:hypothetical protein
MLTIKEKSVVDQLRAWKVSTKKRLCHHLQISHMTVVRALKKFGYHTSYNKNSAFYTLHDIPEFDMHGLWAFRDIYFSRYATLDETIVALVETSDAGYTVGELNNIVKTEIKNILPRLCRKKRLNRYYSGRFVIYVSTDRNRESEQKIYRKEQLEKSKAALRIERQPLPEKLDAITVIKVLVQMIEFPKASDASISKTLQRQGVMITAKAVRSIIEFYSLQKKWNIKCRQLGQ